MVGGPRLGSHPLVVFARWAPWPAFAGALLFAASRRVVSSHAAAGIRVPQYPS